MKKGTRIISAVCLVLFLLSMSACSSKKTDSKYYEEYTKIPMSYKWKQNYGRVRELAASADLIAYITIKDMRPDESTVSAHTIYTAEIDELMFGEKAEQIQIYAIGGVKVEEGVIYELIDDPLMSVGDRYLIFAEKNDDGTYSVLSGGQGRFVINDDKISSLSVANEQVKNSKRIRIKIDRMSKKKFDASVKNFVKNR